MHKYDGKNRSSPPPLTQQTITAIILKTRQRTIPAQTALQEHQIFAAGYNEWFLRNIIAKQKHNWIPNMGISDLRQHLEKN